LWPSETRSEWNRGRAEPARIGIYEIKGDELKLCIHDGKTPPTAFDSTKKNEFVLLVLKRVKK